MKPRSWFVAAGSSSLLATLTYGYGAWCMFVPDKQEWCTRVVHQRYDSGYALSDERFFPLTQKCNASYDMVPAFVNPSVVLFLVSAALCAGVGAAVRRRYPASP